MDLTTQISYGDLASIVGALLTTVSIAFGVYVYARNAQRDRVKRTLDYWESVNQKLKTVKNQLHTTYGDCITEQQADAIFQNGPDRLKANKVLNHYERLALGVNLNIYDMETVNRIAGGRLIDNYHRFEHYIDLYTEKRAQSGKQPVQAWDEFTTLVQRLRRMRP